MPRLLIIAAIAFCYFVFAILLNSVGTVILQSINTFDISKTSAASLEGFKDLSIAFVSFAVASFIPRIGYKIALLISLVAVASVCLVVPLWAEFAAVKTLFAAIGAAFALAKVSVYAMVGQLTDSTKSHSALLNTIEGIFMLGVLSGYWVFSFFIDGSEPGATSWMSVYYLLSAVVAASAVLVLVSPIQRPDASQVNTSAAQAFTDMLKLAYQPLVLIFVLSIFLYVLVEQGIGSWLPTFNNQVLGLPVSVSVQITSLFAFSIALGRLCAGQVLRYVSWFPFLVISALLMMALILLSLPLADGADTQGIQHLWQAPIAAYLLPLIGLLMAPIYPILNSVMLSSLPKHNHAAMTGLIVIFSALGGTSGSLLIGWLFEIFGGEQAFYTLLVPIIGIVLTLIGFRKVAASSSVVE